MTTNTWRSRARRALAILTATTVGGALAVAGATPAAADEPADREVVGGTAEWGVKESFVSYIGRVGDITPSAGASESDGGAFVFPNATGVVSDGGVAVDFEGAIEFAAHY
ncbi:MAG TPA: HtaA domain-containing protein, partial [Actinomycetaceae bacterium]|nr:HtaA domain-containing protein [Actinomycetaceae bacterium]